MPMFSMYTVLHLYAMSNLMKKKMKMLRQDIFRDTNKLTKLIFKNEWNFKKERKLEQ